MLVPRFHRIQIVRYKFNQPGQQVLDIWSAKPILSWKAAKGRFVKIVVMNCLDLFFPPGALYVIMSRSLPSFPQCAYNPSEALWTWNMCADEKAGGEFDQKLKKLEMYVVHLVIGVYLVIWPHIKVCTSIVLSCCWQCVNMIMMNNVVVCWCAGMGACALGAYSEYVVYDPMLKIPSNSLTVEGIQVSCWSGVTSSRCDNDK